MPATPVTPAPPAAPVREPLSPHLFGVVPEVMAEEVLPPAAPVADNPALALAPPARSGVATATTQVSLVAPAPRPPRPVEVHWIGGAADKSPLLGVQPTHLMRDAMDEWSKKMAGTHRYWGYEDVAAVVWDIVARRNESGVTPRLVIVGHSWGGTAAKHVVNALAEFAVPVDTLVTLDAVSALPVETPDNQRTWINVYQKPTLLDAVAAVPLVGQAVAAVVSGFGSLFGAVRPGDAVATAGGQTGREPRANVDLEVEVGHVDIGEMLAVVQSKVPKLFEK